MTLPKITQPLYQISVPSTGIEYNFRPFLVKEEKILLMAEVAHKETDDNTQLLTAICQVINNCCQSEGFLIDKLTMFDVEYIFLKLYSVSVSNIINLSYIDTEDSKKYDFEINLDNVQIKNKPKQNEKIMLSDKVGFVLQYPTISSTLQKKDMDSTDIIKESINRIFDEDSVYAKDLIDDSELTEFIDSFTIDTLNKINTFIEEMPKMYYVINYKNSLNNDRKVELGTLADFFMS